MTWYETQQDPNLRSRFKKERQADLLQHLTEEYIYYLRRYFPMRFLRAVSRAERFPAY